MVSHVGIHDLPVEVKDMVLASSLSHARVVLPSEGLENIAASQDEQRVREGTDFVVVSDYPLFSDPVLRVWCLARLQRKVLNDHRIVVGVLDLDFTNAIKLLKALQVAGNIPFFDSTVHGFGARSIIINHILSEKLEVNPPKLDQWNKKIKTLERQYSLNIIHYARDKAGYAQVGFAALSKFLSAHPVPSPSQHEQRHKILRLFREKAQSSARTHGTLHERQRVPMDMVMSLDNQVGTLYGRDGTFRLQNPQPLGAVPLGPLAPLVQGLLLPVANHNNHNPLPPNANLGLAALQHQATQQAATHNGWAVPNLQYHNPPPNAPMGQLFAQAQVIPPAAQATGGADAASDDEDEEMDSGDEDNEMLDWEASEDDSEGDEEDDEDL